MGIVHNFFPGRTAQTIYARYHRLQQGPSHRWTLEDKNIMQDLLGEEKDIRKIDWKQVQQSLPQSKPLSLIQQYYRNSMDSGLNKGKWRKEEIEQLLNLVTKHRKDWSLISEKLGNRSQERCRQKYWYEMETCKSKKGRFSKEEDESLIDAVNKYGTESFSKIKKEMKSERTTQQLRGRYNNFLDPAIDKSPWTQEEKNRVCSLYTELKSMKLVKEKMNSKRSLIDLRNHMQSMHKDSLQS